MNSRKCASIERWKMPFRYIEAENQHAGKSPITWVWMKVRLAIWNLPLICRVSEVWTAYCRKVITEILLGIWYLVTWTWKGTWRTEWIT